MIDCLLKYKENDLSKEVIVPLLKKIYGERVEFTGGGIEKGRDIIVYKKDELGFNDFIGIQVKKIEATPNSTTKSFQQLLTQLSQMKSEGVVDQTTGDKVKFKKLIFITPYQIYDRCYDSHNNAYKEVLDMGVLIIDGQKLSKLIKEHMPELIRKITGDNSYIGEKIKTELSNEKLMNALNFKNKKNLCDIYCEISLVVGDKSKKSISKCSYNKENTRSSLSIINIKEAIKHDAIIRETLGVKLFNNRGLVFAKKYHEMLKHIDDELERLRGENVKLNKKMTYIIAQSKFKDKYPQEMNLSEISLFVKSGFEDVEIKDDKLSFYLEVNSIKELLEQQEIVRAELQKNIQNKNKSKKSISIPINSKDITSCYNEKVNDITSKRESSTINIKEYLINSKKISECQKVLDSYPEYFYHIDDENIKTNSNISIDRAFDTGLNIVVLGEAGSGKTTNLQVYAHKLYQLNNDLIIYMTLNELASLSISESNEYCLLTGIRNYLFKLGLNNFSIESLSKEFKNNKTKLILDSIDEAITEYHWIIYEINKFAIRYDKCQIITSSRFTVAQVSDLSFVNISLLPFDNKQKNMFFNKWFHGDLIKTKHIMDHLSKNKKLNEIITNPLSATIMATLQESNVPLPKTEASLYKKRFELLSGLFDRFKGINRMDVQPEVLLESARYLAFNMHYSNKRSLTINKMKSIINEKVNDEQETELIVNNLITPSEILLINNDASYGFGHLRFQEYLASEQLINIRSISTNKLITNQWWHDVYLLYSQHAHEIEWIINDASSNGYTSKIVSLLKEMVSNRNMKEQERLNRRIEIAIADEKENY